MTMTYFAKTLIFMGVVLIGVGLFVLFLGKAPDLGRPPGDIYIRKGNFTFYFPLATCLIASLILTFLFSLFGKK